MNDREMLEWAAKACGYIWSRAVAEERKNNDIERAGLWIDGVSTNWNPLEYDSAALRLAVRLCLTVKVEGHECKVFNNEGECLSSVPIMGSSCFANPKDATNPYAATRRAIVRAAAEVGKAMEG